MRRWRYYALIIIYAAGDIIIHLSPMIKFRRFTRPAPRLIVDAATSKEIFSAYRRLHIRFIAADGGPAARDDGVAAMPLRKVRCMLAATLGRAATILTSLAQD